jgi:hypothetical protein
MREIARNSEPLPSAIKILIFISCAGKKGIGSVMGSPFGLKKITGAPFS